MRIHEVLAGKPLQHVITVRPEATVRELIALLAEHNVGALVSEDGNDVAGIVSERDVVRHLKEDESVLDSAVSTIMTSEVQTCTRDQRINDLMQVMTTGRSGTSPSSRTAAWSASSASATWSSTG